jgi:hypothetical protein
MISEVNSRSHYGVSSSKQKNDKLQEKESRVSGAVTWSAIAAGRAKPMSTVVAGQPKQEKGSVLVIEPEKQKKQKSLAPTMVKRKPNEEKCVAPMTSLELSVRALGTVLGETDKTRNASSNPQQAVAPLDDRYKKMLVGQNATGERSLTPMGKAIALMTAQVVKSMMQKFGKRAPALTNATDQAASVVKRN